MSGASHALLGALSLMPLLAASGSLLASGLAGAVDRTEWSAGWKSATVLLCLTLPLLMASTFLTAGFLPSMLDVLGVASDNCEPGHTHHPHLCPLHPSTAIQGPALCLCAAGLVWTGAILMAGARSATRVVWPRLDRKVVIEEYDLPDGQRMTLRAASEGLRVPVRLVRSPIPVAALVGVIHPRVLVSTTLLELLSEEELRAVLRHEAAHYERKDLLVEIFINVFSACHLPVLGRRLRAMFHEATEMACDERAAAHLGSGLPSASALLRLHRWAITTRRTLELPQGVVVGLLGASLLRNGEKRVRHLVEWSGTTGGPGPFSARLWVPVLGIMVVILVACGSIHHLLEDLLGLLSA